MVRYQQWAEKWNREINLNRDFVQSEIMNQPELIQSKRCLIQFWVHNLNNYGHVYAYNLLRCFPEGYQDFTYPEWISIWSNLNEEGTAILLQFWHCYLGIDILDFYRSIFGEYRLASVLEQVIDWQLDEEDKILLDIGAISNISKFNEIGQGLLEDDRLKPALPWSKLEHEILKVVTI